MRNILLSAFSIPVMRAVCCNLNLNFIFFNGSHYLLLLKYSVQNGDIQWILFLFVRLFSFFILFYFLKKRMTKGHWQTCFFVCFWSMLSFIGETTVCVFWQLSTLSCSPTNFVPLLKTINKKKLKYICVSWQRFLSAFLSFNFIYYIYVYIL